MTTSKPQEQTDYLTEILVALESEDSLMVQDILADLHPADLAGVLEGIPPDNPFALVILTGC